MHPILPHISAFVDFVKTLRTPLFESFLDRAQERALTLCLKDERVHLDCSFGLAAPSGHERMSLKKHIETFMTDDRHEDISSHLGMICRSLFETNTLEADSRCDFQFSLSKSKDFKPVFTVLMPGNILNNPILEDSLVADTLEDLARNILILSKTPQNRNFAEWWVRFEKFSVRIHARTPYEAAALCLIFYPQEYEKCMPTNIGDAYGNPVVWDEESLLALMEDAKDAVLSALK